MKIHGPSFSGSIVQDNDNALAQLSGSFTGSFKGDINVSQATFDDVIINDTLTLGNELTDIHTITGSVNLTGSFTVDGGNVNTINGGQVQVNGVNVLDSAIAFAIALG
jgi:hypothetical protein